MTLGIGIDVVDVQRFRKVLQRREKISSRLFTDKELSYCHTVVDPAERMAVRFARSPPYCVAVLPGLPRTVAAVVVNVVCPFVQCAEVFF